LHVLVRPRAGDFIYDDCEQADMLAAVQRCRAEAVDGVAIGCLTADGQVDERAMRSLVSAARPMSVTFHRAFDDCRDRGAALETLVALGVDRVLTSGGGRAASGPGLAATIARAEGRIGVIAAGGIRHHNVVDIVRVSGAREIHFSERLLPVDNGAGGERLVREIDRIVVSARAAAGR
jgi:copper homeostasis protein